MLGEPKPGIYEHYKGGQYEVIGIGRNSESLEELVFYKALYSSEEFGKNSLWVRPRGMFLGTIEVKGVLVPRFKYINENI